MSEKSSPWKSFISGALGGLGVVLAGHPLDTIKVKIQSSGSGGEFASGIGDVVRKSYKAEGVRGFYKGMSAPLLCVSPLIATSFWGYAVGKKVFEKPGHQLTYGEYFLAGVISGLFTTPVIVPFDRVKCLLQVQTGRSVYAGPLDCIKCVVRKEGAIGLYRGTLLTLIRDSPGGGIFYGSYEYFLRNLPNTSKDQSDKNLLKIILAGGLAGSVFWIYGVIPDCLKTRHQIAPAGAYRGLFHLLSSTLKTEGVRPLFNGFTVILARAFLTNAICFTGYEYGLKFLNSVYPPK